MAVAVAVRAQRLPEAILLARRASVKCEAVMGKVVPKASVAQATELAEFCRRKDGSYPYLAMAERAYSAGEGSADRRRLIDHAVEAILTDRSTEVRGNALMFVEHAETCKMLTGDQLTRARARVGRLNEPPDPPGTTTLCWWIDPPTNPYPELRKVSNPSVRTMSPADLEREIAAARQLTGPEKVGALLAIAGGLIGSVR